jgi:hypothetical protein
MSSSNYAAALSTTFPLAIASTFQPCLCESRQQGTANSVTSSKRLASPAFPDNGQKRPSDAVSQPESNMTKKAPASRYTATMNTRLSIWDEESSESRRDLIAANGVLERLLSRKRQAEPMITQKASPKRTKGLTGRPNESLGPVKTIAQEMADAQPDSENMQVRGNQVTMLDTSTTPSKNRCVRLQALPSR